MATYPQTKIEVIETYQPLHLSRGEADIALRIGKKPPDNLIARKLTGFSVAEYASKSYVENHDLDDPQSASRICSIDIDMGSPPAEFDKSRWV